MYRLLSPFVSPKKVKNAEVSNKTESDSTKSVSIFERSG